MVRSCLGCKSPLAQNEEEIDASPADVEQPMERGNFEVLVLRNSSYCMKDYDEHRGDVSASINFLKTSWRFA